MRKLSFGIGGLSMAAVLLAMISSGQAQTPRPWVDPPPETGPAPSPSPAPTGGEAKPTIALPHSPTPAAQAAPGMGKEKKEPQEASTSTMGRPTAKASVQKKVISDNKPRPSSRTLTARRDRSKPLTQRREVAEQTARGTRAERVREGVNSGLEVMTLRTIEFPDGRRIQILTRPSPGAVSELMTSPE